MRIGRNNLISGIAIIVIGLVLLQQARPEDFLTPAGGVNPMEYPRALLYVFLVVGALTIVSPVRRASADDLPFFSLRTAAVAAILLLYALLITRLGFAVTSFLAACGIAWAMGWRRVRSLVLVNLAGVACIWFLFNSVLKLKLPEGLFL